MQPEPYVVMPTSELLVIGHALGGLYEAELKPAGAVKAPDTHVMDMVMLPLVAHAANVGE